MKKVVCTLLIVMLIAVQLVPILNVKAETLIIKGVNNENLREDLVMNTVTLEVQNIDSNDNFVAYKIIDVFYNRETNEVNYDFTSDFKTFLNQTPEYGQNFTIDRYFGLTSDNPDGSVSTSVITTSTLNVMLSKYATYINQNNLTGTNMLTNGSTATAQVTAGSYLILPNNINGTYIYGVLVANVTPKIENNTWVMNDTQVVAKYSSTEGASQYIMANVTAKFFKENAVDISMGRIPVELSTDYKDYKINKEFVVDFASKIPTLPTNAINKIWEAEFIYPMGLDINLEDGFAVEGVNIVVPFSGNKVLTSNGVEIATITTGEKEITENGETKMFKSTKITLDYNNFNGIELLQVAVGFKLNENAIIGGNGNEIRKIVTYTKDPYVLNSTQSHEAKLTAYTYGLEITTFGERQSDGSYPLLTGGEYDVYSDEALSTKVGKITIDENGQGVLKGVAGGTHYLKQTRTTTGYQLIREPIAIEVATENAVDTDKDGYYEKAIYNETLWFLPSTGGIGTIIYTMIGLVIIAVASFGVIYYRKNQLKINN